MGSICSRSSAVDSAPSGGFSLVNGYFNHGSGLVYHSQELIAHRNVPPSVGGTSVEIKQLGDPLSPVEVNVISHGISPSDINDGIPRLLRVLSDKSQSTKSKQAAISRVTEMSSLLGRAGTAGLGKAVDVLDTLGSSMTNLSISSGFTSGVVTKGNKISILAFEVANTIVKGANLMHSLSQDNIRHLKEVVLPSEGVQNLISRDMNELLRIAAADKREELKVFSGEVVRFGNRCRDPQWHNLDRYFDKLGSELILEKQLKEEVETVMQQLMTLVQFTAEEKTVLVTPQNIIRGSVDLLLRMYAELYHEMHALDRFQQDYRRKLQEEEKQNPGQRGDNLAIFKADLKSQKKHVKSLKRKSLWSKILEEVMEKLVDIVYFLHLEIYEAFPSTVGDQPPKISPSDHMKLGSASLALHYANIITQIDTLVSRSSSIPPNTRDALYEALPLGVKSALRSRLRSFHVKEEFSVQQIKGEMEKTLQWLVPIATNTTKAHHGFGWVGEWANTRSEVNRKASGQTDLLRIETLHHADKEKTETYIFELVVWLHHLVIQARSANCGMRSPMKSPIQSPSEKIIQISMQKPESLATMLTVEDQEMLQNVGKRKKTPGISKSQELNTTKMRLTKYHRLSRSSSHSPTRESKRDPFPFPVRRPSLFPVIDFDIDRMKALDVIDRVDRIQGI